MSSENNNNDESYDTFDQKPYNPDDSLSRNSCSVSENDNENSTSRQYSNKNSVISPNTSVTSKSMRTSIHDIGTIERAFSLSSKNRHKFKKNYFSTPTFCDFCGSMILGVFSQQGLRCKTCHYACHYECERKAIAVKCLGSVKAMELARLDKKKLKDEFHSLVNNLKNMLDDKIKTEEIYKISDPKSTFEELKNNDYLFDEIQQQFIKSKNYTDSKRRIQAAVKCQELRKHNKELRKLNEISEICSISENFNSNLFRTQMIWILNYANFVVHLPEENSIFTEKIHQDIFGEFPELYKFQIDCWKNFMRDLDDHGRCVCVEVVLRCFLGMEFSDEYVISPDDQHFKRESPEDDDDDQETHKKTFEIFQKQVLNSRFYKVYHNFITNNYNEESLVALNYLMNTKSTANAYKRVHYKSSKSDGFEQKIVIKKDEDEKSNKNKRNNAYNGDEHTQKNSMEEVEQDLNDILKYPEQHLAELHKSIMNLLETFEDLRRDSIHHPKLTEINEKGIRQLFPKEKYQRDINMLCNASLFLNIVTEEIQREIDSILGKNIAKKIKADQLAIKKNNYDKFGISEDLFERMFYADLIPVVSETNPIAPPTYMYHLDSTYFYPASRYITEHQLAQQTDQNNLDNYVDLLQGLVTEVDIQLLDLSNSAQNDSQVQRSFMPNHHIAVYESCVCLSKKKEIDHVVDRNKKGENLMTKVERYFLIREPYSRDLRFGKQMLFHWPIWP